MGFLTAQSDTDFESQFFDCQNDSNAPDNICLVYVPYTEHAICETPGSPDLAECDLIAANHVAEAIQYRPRVGM